LTQWYFLIKNLIHLTKNVNLPDKKCQVEAVFFDFSWFFQPVFELARCLLKAFVGANDKRKQREKRII